jgi:GDP-D-mannose 3', 5'-epimerase
MNWSSKRVLVTGGAGHIGSALVERLVNEGAHVKVADNLWRGSKEYLYNDNGIPMIDLEKDFLEVDLREYNNALLASRDTGVIFHLADVVAGITFVFDNLPFVYRSNALINSNVFHAAEENRVATLVYVGAACAYPHYKQNDPNHPLFKEEDMYPAEPESAYGWSKLMGEYECGLYSQSGILDTAILRLHNVYGPHSDLSPERSQVIPATIRKAIRYPNEKFVIWGHGNQNRSFVYVSDIVDALILAVEKGINKGPIQIGTETKTTIEEIADKVIEISGKSIKKEHDLTKPVGDLGRAADCGLAELLLGWKPKVDIDEGLERTYKWASEYLKSHGNT